MDIDKLIGEFNGEMEGLYEKIVNETKGKYKPTSFKIMVEKYGGFVTAKKLLDRSDMTEGLTRLFILGREDLSLENIVLEDKWKELFNDKQLKKAELWLGK